MKWNVKCKIYPDGSTNTIYCNQRIFNDTPTARQPKENTDDTDKKIVLRKMATVGKSGYYDEVRDDSLKRAKDKIQDIVLCNNFNYFVTLTFNPEKVDSFNVEAVKGAIKNWLNNGVKRRGFSYIAIPEYHKSGRIHLHALMSGNLKLADSGHTHNGRTVYHITDWKEKFGFCTAVKIDGNIANLSYYITKYITKGNDKIFGRFYWSSKNLVREPEIAYAMTDFGDVNQFEYKVPNCTRKLKYEADFKFEN